MFEEALVMPDRPPCELLFPHFPREDCFLVALGGVYVSYFPTMQVELVGEVGVLCEFGLVEFSDSFQYASPETSDSSPELRDKVQVVPCLLIDLVAPSSLNVHESGHKRFWAVYWNHPAHNPTDLYVNEGSYKSFNAVTRGQVVGVEGEDYLV